MNSVGASPRSAASCFFLDESGSSRDAIHTGKALDFVGQQIFVLAAIGTSKVKALEVEMARLAARYRLRSGEIKSSALARTPGFAANLADYLASADCPIFLEVMDKRYLIVANLINHMLLPPVPGIDEDADSHLMRAVLGDVVYETIPNVVLLKFAGACEAPSRRSVEAVFEALCGWATHEPALGEYRDVVVEMVSDCAADFAAALEPDAYRRWLPLADRCVTGRPIWMLPGLSALTNIYARINKYRAGALADVSLIHDEHMLYGNIFSDAKALMETLSAQDVLPYLPNADYHLQEHAEFAFRKSEATLGIQAADVIGGFVMRFVRDFLYGRRPTPDRDRAMASILALSKPTEARGLNFVASKRDLARLGISWR